jgi:hypothetical protein
MIKELSVEAWVAARTEQGYHPPAVLAKSPDIIGNAGIGAFESSLDLGEIAGAVVGDAQHEAGAAALVSTQSLGIHERCKGGDDLRTAYQDFLALWKDADLDLPVLVQAKAEYAKLQ